jgi:hypothetical protein
MIDWPLLLAATIVRRGTIYNVVYDRYSDVALWIANRINRRLAGYEAMKKLATDQLAYYLDTGEDPIEMAAILAAGQLAEEHCK